MSFSLFYQNPVFIPGHKLSVSSGFLSTYKESLITDVHNLATVEVNGFNQRQLLIGGEHLDWLIATRSTNQIALFSFSWTAPFELKMIGSYHHQGSRITDLKFCPFNFPELVFCCMDGSLHGLELDSLMMSQEQDLEMELTAEEIHLVGSSSPVRALCEYAHGPGHLLLAQDTQILSINRIQGNNHFEIVLKFDSEERVLCMQSTKSNLGSPNTDPYLIAILTNLRLQLNDTRSFPETLLSWDIKDTIISSNFLNFNLHDHGDSERTQLGRVIYGDLHEGDLHEVTFLIGGSRVQVEAPMEAGRCIGIKRRLEEDPGGLEVVMSRRRQYCDFISLFAYGLVHFNDAFHSRTVNIPSFVDRMNWRYPVESIQQRLMPSRELSRWKEYFRRSVDTLGVSFLPLDPELSGLLIRINPIGDLVFHRVSPVEDPETIRKNQRLLKEDWSFRVVSSPWPVTREWPIEIRQESYWTGSKEVLELDSLDLNCGRREMIVLQPKWIPPLTQLWLNVPLHLMSTRLNVSGKMTYSSVGGSEASRYAPPLPLTFHQRFFKETFFLPNEGMERNKIVLNLRQQDVQSLLKRTHGMSLWTLHYDLLYYHFKKDGEDLDNAKKKFGKDFTKVTHFQNRVRKENNKPISIAMELVASHENAKLLGKAYLDGVKSFFLDQFQKRSTPTFKHHKVKIIPPVYCTKGKDFMHEMRSWESDFSQEDLTGADEVFIPTMKKEDNETPEIKINFQKSKFKPIISLPPSNEEEKFKLKDLETSWQNEWRQKYSRNG